MKKTVFLSCFGILLLVSLVAVPALAATVSCPSSCSCLLPAEAKKTAAPGYCQGKQAICGYDTLKNEKYCYEKTTTKPVVPQLIVPAKTLVTTTPTTIPPQNCASGCSCLSTADGKAKGLLYCGGKQILCGYDTDKTPLYCFTLPTTPTNTPAIVAGLYGITATPTVTLRINTTLAACPTSCSCFAPDKADAAGFPRCIGTSSPCSYDPLGRPMYCYIADRVTMVSPVPADGTLPDISSRPPSDGPVPEVERRTTTPVPSDNPPPSIFASIGSFFASFFGGSSPPQSSSLQPVPCNGIMTNVMTDPHNCGSCGAECSSGSCIAGKCAGTSGRVTACGPGAVLCDGTCTYVRSDGNNCGSCGHRCGTGETCCSGSCTVLSTTDHCGACGNVCGRGETCCSGWCADSSADRLNCGGCGHVCPGSSVCENSVCVDKTCEEALFAERKTNAELRAQLARLSDKYSTLEKRFEYCLWLEDYYKEGYEFCCGDHCMYPPEPTEDVPMVLG